MSENRKKRIGENRMMFTDLVFLFVFLTFPSVRNKLTVFPFPYIRSF